MLAERHREAGWLLWQLLGELGRLFRSQMDPDLREIGLGSPVEVWVCRLVLTEGPRRLVDIAHTTCLPVSTLSDMTDRLVSDGFLRREPHPRDRRSTVLAATDRAREAVSRLRQLVAGRFEAVLATMDDATLDQLTVGLRAMAAALRQDDDGPPVPGCR